MVLRERGTNWCVWEHENDVTPSRQRRLTDGENEEMTPCAPLGININRGGSAKIMRRALQEKYEVFSPRIQD
jgi:hypothetical protein